MEKPTTEGVLVQMLSNHHIYYVGLEDKLAKICKLLRRVVICLIVLITIGLGIFISSVAKADTTVNARLLIHGHRAIGENGWGIAGWIVAPNITSKPNKWYGVAGVRYDWTGANLEVMAGALVESGAGKYMLDIRWGLDPKILGIPLVIWNNEQFVDLSFKEWYIYSYLRVVYVLPEGIGMVGVETENLNFKDKPDDYSFGVHAIIPIAGPLVLIPAYQWHFTPGEGYTGSQFWLRVVLDFK